MPKLGDVILSLSGKAGVKKDDETLKKLMALQEVSMFELPDEIAQALEQNLLTADSAIVNPNVRGKIVADALDGVDKEVERIVNDFGFDDTFKSELKTINKNTNEKIRRVSAQLRKELEAAKEKASHSKSPEDKKEVEVLKKQIDDYNQKLEDQKRMYETDAQNLAKSYQEKEKGYILKSVLAGKPLPKNGVSQNVNIITAKTLVEEELAKHGLHFSVDETGNAVLKQRKDGVDMDYFVDNKKVDFSSLVDGVLAAHKFLQVNDQPQQNNAPGVNGSQPQAGVPTNTAIAAESRSKLAQLGLGATV